MRLALDFNKNSSQERLNFLYKYIDNNKGNFTEDNLEMMANYILWAVEQETNEDFQIESKNSPWSKRQPDISYEGLLEQEKETGMPAEILVRQDNNNLNKKAKLDRQAVIHRLTKQSGDIGKQRMEEEFIKEKDINSDEEIIKARKNNVFFFPEEWHPLASAWFNLWAEIDQTEYIIQSWEIKHGKRRADLPIREELLNRLIYMLIYKNRPICLKSLRAELEEEADKWDGYFYLKKKRQLVQLRTQQYSLLDCIGQDFIQKHINAGTYYSEPMNNLIEFFPFMSDKLLFDEIKEEFFNKENQQIFVQWLNYSDKAYDKEYAKKHKIIDLRDSNVIRQLLFYRTEIKENLINNKVLDREINEKLIKYIDYYIGKCNFSDDLVYILNEKIKKKTNKEIVEGLQKNFGITYKDNYISTIFTKRIIEAIVEQVNLHYRMIEYITMGRSVFKVCSKCGKILPRNSDYFNKRTSTSDGFFSYCKNCRNSKKK